jgi:type II secretory ATPase GspE/PulE/Tfp pilus assembly ATPase PilB-like protein
LVRRLCPECREAYEPDDVQREMLTAMNEGRPFDAPVLYRPKGCRACDNVGYKGRVGVHEVLTVDEKFQALTMRQAETKALRLAGIEAGMVPMVGDGLEKAAAGLTTVEEVQKRIGFEMAPGASSGAARPALSRRVAAAANGEEASKPAGVRRFLPKLDEL